MSFKGSLARPLVWPTEPEPRLKALPYWAPRRNHLSLKAQELAGFALRAIAGRAAASDPYAESANLRVVNSATLRPRPRPRQTSSQRPVFYRAPMRPVPPEFAAPLLTFALAPSPWAPPPEVVPLEVAPSEVAPSDIKLEESAIIKSDNIISANILSDSQITPAPNDLGLSQEPPLAKKAPRQFRPWVWVLGLALVAVALAWGVAKKIELNSAAPTAPEVKTEGLVGAQPAEANLGSTEAAEVLPLAKKDLARYLGARLIDEKDPRFLTALGPDQDQLIAETT
ncbi:MAG: hypothetical protein LBT38_11595, partial [Deltaproteobacteria bacterium]|nr:hypothetical protein [Deltaproteobacteria bacterium]